MNTRIIWLMLFISLLLLPHSHSQEVVSRPLADSKINPEEFIDIPISVVQCGLPVQCEFDARIEYPAFAGSNYFLALELNGKPLSEQSLINKPIQAELENGDPLDWYYDGFWKLVTAPNFDLAAQLASPPPYRVKSAPPYHFTFNLGLLKSGQHNLRIKNRSLKSASPSLRLIISNFEVKSLIKLHPKGVQEEPRFYTYQKKSSIEVLKSSSQSIPFQVDRQGSFRASFSARHHFSYPAGISFALRVKVDGVFINGDRLRNRGRVSLSQDRVTREMYWGDYLALMVGPNDQDNFLATTPANYRLANLDPYFYEIDLGFLTNGSHTFEIVNATAPSIISSYPQESLTIFVKDFQVKRFLVGDGGDNENILLYQKESEIQPEWADSWKFHVSDPTQEVKIRFKARADYPYLAGWSYSIDPRIDGAPLSESMLVNRREKYGVTKTGQNVPWNSNGRWLTYYAPSNSTALESGQSAGYQFVGDDAAVYEFNLGKLSAGIHEFSLTNRLPYSYVTNYNAPFHLVINELRVSQGGPLMDRFEIQGTTPGYEAWTQKYQFQARTDYPSLAGLNWGLKLYSDGNLIAKNMREGIGSSYFATTANGAAFPWMSEEGGWLNCTGSNFKEALDPTQNSAYRFSDGINPYAFTINPSWHAGPYRFAMESSGLRGIAESSGQKFPLIISDFTAESLFPIPPEQTVTIDFTVPQGNGDLLLSLWARVDYPSLAGNTGALNLKLDGQGIAADQLINKPREFETYLGNKTDWYAGSNGVWVTLVAPDFEQASNLKGSNIDNSAVLNGRAHHYVFNLKGLTPGSKHSLKIRNNVSAGLASSLGTSLNLMIKNLSIYRGDVLSKSTESEAVPAGDVEYNPLNSVNYQMSASEGTGIQLKWLNSNKTVESLISYSGANQLKIGSNPTAGWTWTKTEVNATTTQLQGVKGAFTLLRTILRNADHIRVTDKFINSSSAEIGLKMSHSILTNQEPEEKLFVQGLPYRKRELFLSTPQNPTMFISTESQYNGIGLHAEDDVFRVHSQGVVTPQSIGLRDETLAVPAGSSYSQEWTIYMTETPDYFEFANRIRKNKNHSMTIPGPYLGVAAGARTDDQMRALLDGTGIATVNISQGYSDDGKYCYGLGLLNGSSNYRLAVKNTIAQIKRLYPQMNIITYFDTIFNTGPESEEAPYADSRNLGADGAQVQYYGFGHRAVEFYGTKTNTWGTNFVPALKNLYLNEFGCGPFWDQFIYSSGPRTYRGPWDGYSAELDGNNNVTRKFSDITLLTQGFTGSLYSGTINDFISAGKIVYSNNQPITREVDEMKKIFSVIETGIRSDSRLAHLHCPIGLGNWYVELTTEDVVYNIRRNLEDGVLYNYVVMPLMGDHVLKKVYPIKPLQLNNGYIWGENKLFTKRSGRYCFGNSKTLTAYLYDEKGIRLPNATFTKETIGGKTWITLDLPSKYMAVVEAQ